MFMTQPVRALVVVFGENAVILPYPGSPPDLAHELHVMDADGSNTTRLINNPVIEAEPIWSPTP